MNIQQIIDEYDLVGQEISYIYEKPTEAGKDVHILIVAEILEIALRAEIRQVEIVSRVLDYTGPTRDAPVETFYLTVPAQTAFVYRDGFWLGMWSFAQHVNTLKIFDDDPAYVGV